MQFKFFTILAAFLAVALLSRPLPSVAEDHRCESHLIGDPIPGFNAPEGLTTRAAQSTMVTFCSSRIGNICGGACNVYNGGPTCIAAPDTVCLSATHDVGFCDRAGCTNSCNSYNSCGTRLDNGFCYTPGTRSILVGNY
ncbi:hypothetical protein EV122DRAFT_262522 [Schizophyllum commune]